MCEVARRRCVSYAHKKRYTRARARVDDFTAIIADVRAIYRVLFAVTFNDTPARKRAWLCRRTVTAIRRLPFDVRTATVVYFNL